MPQQFLSKILPALPAHGMFGPEQCYFALGLAPNQPPKQRVCFSIQEIVDQCAWMSHAGLNAYMACASFAEFLGGRKAANAYEMRSLWADIDVGKSSSPYGTIEEALASVLKFHQVTGLKPSIVVQSGKGLHVYWCFNRNIAAHLWKQVAAYFHQLCKQEGLGVDASRATDAASVLRLPGTIHQSTQQVVKVLLDTGVIYNPADFTKAVITKLQAIAPLVQQVTSVSKAQQDAMAAFGLGPQPPSAKAEPIVRACPQMLTMGLGTEPQWFAAMSVLKRCTDGLEWCHKLSMMDAVRYNAEAMEAKYARAPEDSPATCATFDRLSPGMCTNCPYKGQIKSPIQLYKLPGVQPTPSIAAPLVPAGSPAAVLIGEPVHLDLKKAFDYPRVALQHSTFIVDQRGIVMRKSEIDKATGSWVTKEEIICTAQIYFRYSIHEEADMAHKRSYVFELVQPSGKSELARFIIDEHYSEQKVMCWLGNAGVFPTSPAYGGKIFMNFMNAYLQQITHKTVELQTHDTFGWKDTVDATTHQNVKGFVTGSGMITASGLHDIRFSGVAKKYAQREQCAKGDLGKWKYVPQMYKTLNQPIGQLAMCLSFATPFMKYAVGEANSAILSIWSPRGGKGKSQLLRAAASVWGNPDEQFVMRSTSTPARCRKLATLANLPVFLDELTDVSDEDLYGLAYTLVGGKEKDKLKSGGGEFVDTGDWSTVTYTTSNKSFKDAISRRAGDSDATLLRVMEYECDFQSYETMPEVNQYIHECMHLGKENYGLAGPEFIFQVLQRPERLATLTREIDYWISQKKFENNERFMSNALALAIKCGRWAVEFGLLDYDMDALEQWVMDKFVAHNRAQTGSLSVDFMDLLSSYLVDRQPHTLVVTRSKRPKTMADPGTRAAPDSYVKMLPNNSVYIRYEMEEKRCFISKQDFDSWCKRRNVSPQVLLKNLEQRGVFAIYSTRPLCKGLSYMPQATSRSYMLDAQSMQTIGYDPFED